MFGIRYLKGQPNTYYLRYRSGKVVQDGYGLSFFYYSPMTSIVAIPMASADVPFIFREVTSDYQEATIQGQVVYRVADPVKLAGSLDFTMGANNDYYVSEDPEKLPQRIVREVQVLMRGELQQLNLKQALKSSQALVDAIRKKLSESDAIGQLGIDVLSLAVLAITPNPETSRALEAEIREQLLLEADEAIYSRRNAAVEQERVIKENELNTEIAVESKKRQIRETKIDADRAVQEKRQAMEQAEMKGNVTLEEERRELVDLAVQNKRLESDAQAYGVNALMDAFKTVDPKVMQALASVNMDPARLIATGFQNLADNAGRIGNLNIAPELLQSLMALPGYSDRDRDSRRSRER